MMRKLLLSGCLIFLFCSSTRAFGEQSPSDNARNYQSCLAGYASCDQSKLTDTQRDDVHRAALQRNYNSCLYGYASCDQSRLTESEKEAIAKRGSSNTTEAPTSPKYYTNSAGERIQSPTFSPTVPSGATAQCRDGSYSFSRSRRGTCSHHGGVAKWL